MLKNMVRVSPPRDFCDYRCLSAYQLLLFRRVQVVSLIPVAACGAQDVTQQKTGMWQFVEA